MQTGSLSQNPQIEGNSRRQIFTGVDIEMMKYVSVTRRLENEVVLSGGAAHGLTVRSEWAIYPAGAKSASPEDKLGKVTIVDVNMVTSTGKITHEENSRKIEAGCRAIEESHYYRDYKKSVYIDSSSTELKQIKNLITEDIEASSWLTLINTKDEANFVVSVSATESDGEDEKRLRIQILQDDGYVLSQVTNSEDILNIRRNLEKLSRYSMILKLENPSSGLKDFIEFNLLQKKDEQWRRAEPVYNNLPLYIDDEQIAFQVINNYSNVIYVSILDLGLTKKIALLYPPNAASDRLGSIRAATLENPNMGTLQIGVAANQSITLFIPKEAFTADLPEINKEGGIEVFKLIATTSEADFSCVEQDGIRIARGFSSPLEELLYKYSSERQTRDAKIKVGGQNDWLTISRGFYLCKR
jgi:hypothetical protein